MNAITAAALALWLLTPPSWAGDPAALNRAALEAYDGGDFAQAVEIWRRAAAAGDTFAMTALANMYQHGEGVAHDLAAARRWYRQAAEHGDVIGQLNLGDMLITDSGPARDVVAGHFWLSLAARQGHAWAAARRDQVAARMSAHERALSRARQESWQALR